MKAVLKLWQLTHNVEFTNVSFVIEIYNKMRESVFRNEEEKLREKALKLKPIGRKNYGSIPHLHNSKLGEGDYYIGEGQERILTLKARDRHDSILVFEKYDGSNVGVAKVENKIFALTRPGYEASTSPYKQHHYFANWVKKRELLFADMLQNGERITGEWLAQAHGLVYKIEVEPIVFFDYFTPNNERVLFKELRAKQLNTGYNYHDNCTKANR